MPNGIWDISYDARYHKKLGWKSNSDLETLVISDKTFDLVKMDGVLSAKSKVLVRSLAATKHIHNALVSVVEVVSQEHVETPLSKMRLNMLSAVICLEGARLNIELLNVARAMHRQLLAVSCPCLIVNRHPKDVAVRQRDE